MIFRRNLNEYTAQTCRSVSTSFYPAAHDTLSGCGKGAHALQRRLAAGSAQHANNGASPSQHLIDLKANDVLQRVSVAVMRACADSVCKQFAKSPHRRGRHPRAAAWMDD